MQLNKANEDALRETREELTQRVLTLENVTAVVQKVHPLLVGRRRIHGIYVLERTTRYSSSSIRAFCLVPSAFVIDSKKVAVKKGYVYRCKQVWTVTPSLSTACPFPQVERQCCARPGTRGRLSNAAIECALFHAYVDKYAETGAVKSHSASIYTP